MIIYKITNTINNKLYIGLTTCTLEYRWSRHITEGRNLSNNKHLYRSMRKYGEDNFKIEEIDRADNLKSLGELERYYISLYNTRDPNIGYNLTAGGERNQWDGNPAAKLSYDEVVQIREIYFMCELSLAECYSMFSDRMSYSGFQKIWDGTTWKGIMDDIYLNEDVKNFHKTMQRSLPGSRNPSAIYTEDEVLEARKYYVNHTLQETFDKFGKRTKNGFRHMIDHGYSNVPIYKKWKKVWILNNEIIDINKYNPVSTISESGE